MTTDCATVRIVENLSEFVECQNDDPIWDQQMFQLRKGNTQV